MNAPPADLFNGLADFEVEFFTNLMRSYARLDLGMRGFFFHRIRQVVKEAIDLLRADPTPRRDLH